MARQRPSPQKVTIRDVARKAKVSTATVSRVLAGIDVVSDELSERVREVARGLKYQPSRVARSLRAQKARIVGVLIPNIQNPFFTGVIRGIEDLLQATDYTLLLGNSDDHPAREASYLELLRAEGISGLVLVPGRENLAAYRELEDAGIPMVAVDRRVPELLCDSVAVNNQDGAHSAVRHLIALGHRRIAMITGPAAISTATERLQGYLAGLRQGGLPVDEALIAHVPFRQEGGYQAAAKLLDLAQPPTAIFAASDFIALGALRLLHERGVRIPQEMALVTFDDMPWAVALQPPLTAVAQPTYEMGATAARLLLDRLRDPSRRRHEVLLPTQLIVRASCGAAPADSKESAQSTTLPLLRRSSCPGHRTRTDAQAMLKPETSLPMQNSLIAIDYIQDRHPRARIGAAALFVLLLVHGQAGCKKGAPGEPSGPAPGGRPRIALVMKSLANEFFKQMEDGAREHARAHAADYELLANGIKDEQDVGKQIDLVENAVAQGAHAIVLAPADSRALVGAVARAHAAGVIVVNIDNRLDPDILKRKGLAVPFVGPSNRKGAHAAGLMLRDRLKAGDAVAIIEGLPTADNARERRLGFEDAIAEAGLKLVATQAGNWEMARANQIAAALVTEHPGLKAILCANDSMALGAVAALRAAGKLGEIAVIGFDNISAMAELVQKGEVLATVDQHAGELAIFGIETALDLLKHRAPVADRETPVDVIAAN